MKHFLIFFHTVLIVTVVTGNLAASGKNTERIENSLNCLTGDTSVVDACQEDYSPCNCYTYSFDPFLYVQCTDVPSFESVQSVFRRTTSRQVKEFRLTIPSFEENKTIPADLLSGKAAQQITLICPNTETQLTIDPKAFNSSEDYTDFIQFSTCDLSQLDYAFLKNFNVLREFFYFNSINISQWSGLPTLPSLRKLSIDSATDFKHFKNLALSQLPALSEYSIRLCPDFEFLPNTTAIKVLKIESCPLFKQWYIFTQQSKMTSLSLSSFNNQTIKDALDSITSSPSINTLVELILMRNGLTQVPTQIQLFSQLERFTVSYNKISFVGNRSLSFSTLGLKYLDLSQNGLETIESDAFQGYFGESTIYLSYNLMRRMESSVFKSVMEQMESVDRYGYVEVYDNPIECDCHLDWLFVDNTQLVDRVEGKCSNGTYFEWLKPQDFSSCKSGSPIPTTTKPTTESTVWGGASSSHQVLGTINFSILLFTSLYLQKSS